MPSHLSSRPPKMPFPLQKQAKLRDKAVSKIKSLLLPHPDIYKIILMGSSVNGEFGKYEPPGFRGSLFSDFDFIVFVEDDYKIPRDLKREKSAHPFKDESLNLAYRIKNFISGKYDAEVFFVRHSSAEDKAVQKEGEGAGIPMSEGSKNEFILVYER